MVNSISPQAHTVIRHLKQVGSITTLEARRLYKIEQPATAIFDLRRAGYNITTEYKRDLTGQRYAKYHFHGVVEQPVAA